MPPCPASTELGFSYLCIKYLTHQVSRQATGSYSIVQMAWHLIYSPGERESMILLQPPKHEHYRPTPLCPTWKASFEEPSAQCWWIYWGTAILTSYMTTDFPRKVADFYTS